LQGIKYTSIASRLTTVGTVVSGAALILACVTFGIYDRATSRRSTLQNLSIQAQIVAANSITALIFNDPHAAEVTLSALSAAPNIIAAQIYTSDGRLFARYGDGSQVVPANMSKQEREVGRFEQDRIVIERPIVQEGKYVGTVSIASGYRELNSRRDQYGVLAAAVLATSLIAALLMSWRAQRSISAPIVHLAQTARSVTSQGDYAVRAAVKGKTSEIAILAEAFNGMLSEIQQRDQSLRDAHDELEQRVALRTAELDAANKELEAFSYSVSHDLRAPLRHVTGFAAMLQEHAHDQLDDLSRRYLRTITEATQRMAQLIDDLLAFSRIGREQLTRRRVNLNDVVREARQELLSRNGVGSRAIDWHLADLPEVEGDAAMLRQVLLNLLSNAVKYTAPLATARVEIGTTGSGQEEVVVFVRDNGVGFDMQYAHKLFGVFQRLHGSVVFEGTGIGLANVRRIIVRHGGRVWAESDLGHGATFYFSLPMKG
jgi:signal transduction histidine kinase